MMCTYETYLHSSFTDDNPRLNLPGYNLVRAFNNLNKTKRAGVYVYSIESLAVRSPI